MARKATPEELQQTLWMVQESTDQDSKNTKKFLYPQWGGEYPSPLDFPPEPYVIRPENTLRLLDWLET